MELKSKFKLSLLFLIIASPATPVLADYVKTCPVCNFNGLTIGGGLGVSVFMNNIDTDTAIGVATLDPRNNVYKFGAMGSIFLGYGRGFDNHMYLGSELGVNFYGSNRTSLKKESDTSIFVEYTSESGFDPDAELTYTNTLQTQTKVTRNAVEPFLDIKLGRLITPNLLAYLRGGVSYNTMTITSDSSYVARGKLISLGEFGDGPRVVVSNNAVASSLNHSKTDHVVGTRVGGGFEYMVTPNFGIASDYVYTFYQNITSSGVGPGKEIACDMGVDCIIDVVDFSNVSKAKMSDQKVTAELIYHFN